MQWGRSRATLGRSTRRRSLARGRRGRPVGTGWCRMPASTCCACFRVRTGAVRLDGARLVLCGPEQRAWTFELPAETVAVGVRFRPGWASLAFDLDVSTLLDRRVPYADVVGGGGRGAYVPRSGRARHARRASRPAGVCQSRARLDSVGPIDPRFVDSVTEALVGSPRPTQQQLAAAVGITPRHLHRRLVRTFGYGAATIARLLRFQRFLAVRELEQASREAAPVDRRARRRCGLRRPGASLRDCRAITGLTVRRFLAEWFPTFPDMSDPFKTDVPFATTMGA